MSGFVRGSLVAYALPLASWLKYSNVEYISGVQRRTRRCKFRERAVACLKGKLFASGMWKHYEGCTVTRNESPSWSRLISAQIASVKGGFAEFYLVARIGEMLDCKTFNL